MNARTSKKGQKGGSQASTHVSGLVSQQTFEEMNHMFDNTFSLKGGQQKKLLIQDVDVNDKGPSMMLFHKTGGAKKTKAPVKTGKNPTKKKSQKGGNCDGGVGGEAQEGLNTLFNLPIKTPSSMPPSSLPTNSYTSLSMKPIPYSQQALVSKDIDVMMPMEKNIQFPLSGEYKGPFAFGGGAKKKTVDKKKKPVVKKNVPTKPSKTGAKAKPAVPKKK